MPVGPKLAKNAAMSPRLTLPLFLLGVLVTLLYLFPLWGPVAAWLGLFGHP